MFSKIKQHTIVTGLVLLLAASLVAGCAAPAATQAPAATATAAAAAELAAPAGMPPLPAGADGALPAGGPPPRVITPTLANIAYATASSAQMLDIYMPEGTGPFPIVVNIHPGGFFGGSKDMVPGATGQAMLKAGYAVASIDYRLSGEAQFPAAVQDVKAAIRLVRGRSPGPVVLWGVSLGGASVVFAAAKDPTVAGVICDSSYRSLQDTVQHHLQLFRGWRWWLRIVPRWPVAELTLFWIGRRGGFDPATVDVRAAAARLAGRPTLFVANSEDRRMPKEIAFDLQTAAGPGAEVLIVPGKSHGGAWRDGTAAYEAAAAALLDAAGRGAATPVAARGGALRGTEARSRQ